MWTTVFALIAGSVVVAGIVETVKHAKYKDEITEKQALSWAIPLSVLTTPVLYYGFDMLGKPIAMILYAAIVFISQKSIDMKVVRPAIKKIIERKLEKL